MYIERVQGLGAAPAKVHEHIEYLTGVEKEIQRLKDESASASAEGKGSEGATHPKMIIPKARVASSSEEGQGKHFDDDRGIDEKGRDGDDGSGLRDRKRHKTEKKEKKEKKHKEKKEKKEKKEPKSKERKEKKHKKDNER
jgi:hypothetical protein